MNREQVTEIVIRNIKLNIDGLEDIELDTRKSILEYGANSLDLVEIVSSSIRDLGIVISRIELANLESIDDLIDLLTKHVIARAHDLNVSDADADSDAGSDKAAEIEVWIEHEL